MSGQRRRPAFASDDWLREQQLRAELEAEAWGRLRRELAEPAPQPDVYYYPAAPERTAPEPKRFNHHRAGSAALKGLVRFGMAAFAGYLAWLAAVDSNLGTLEIWFAVGAVFIATLALSMLGFARELVHALAEAARWALMVVAGLGLVWLLAGQLS
ncbi:MAG: hypothetical protein K2X34_12830 [Hyphomonadaceae bacterium]|nr:hypothetical protein [Hyphomonadaceae bacterium]